MTPIDSEADDGMGAFDDDDRDDPLEQDLVDQDDSDDVLPCPACGRDVYEDAEKCPHCGDWITPRSGGRLHWIWMVAVALALAGMLVITLF